MSEPKISPQQQREHHEPEENARPVPWFVLAVVGFMFAFGVAYIANSQINTLPEWGDGRTEAELQGPVASAVGAVDGAAIYAARCVACHQVNGGGLPGVFPPLAGSEWVNGTDDTLARILLHGVTGPLTVKGISYNGAMPAFKDQLSDAEIAALMTHIRSQWGNAAGAVAADVVAAARISSAARTSPWNGDADLAAK